jgi:hypothetical protein
MVHIVWYYTVEQLNCITPIGASWLTTQLEEDFFVAKKRIILSILSNNPPSLHKYRGKRAKNWHTRHTRSSIIIVEPRSIRGYNRIGHMAASDYVVYSPVYVRRDQFI